MFTNKLKQAVVYLLQPALVLPAGILILGVAHEADDILAALILITVGLLPMMVLRTYYYFANKQGITSVQRGNLFLAGIVSSSAASTIFGSDIYVNSNWFRLSLILAVAWGLMFIVNQYFEKVSISSFALTFTIIMLVGLVTKVFFFFLPTLGLLSYIKYKTKQHNVSDLLWGITIGLLIGFFTWLINF